MESAACALLLLLLIVLLVLMLKEAWALAWLRGMPRGGKVLCSTPSHYLGLSLETSRKLLGRMVRPEMVLMPRL